MTTIDLNQVSTDDGVAQDWATLNAENQGLRTYLKRVLALLEAKADEQPDGTHTVDHRGVGALRDAEARRRLADLESAVVRVQEDLQTVLLLLTEPEQRSVAS